MTWRGLPVEQRARVWAAFIGVDPEELRERAAAGGADLARDRDALAELIQSVEARRARLAAAGAATEDADALLAKLTWERAALPAPD